MNSITTGDFLLHAPKIPSAKADLIFADPPYNIGYDYGDDEYQDNLTVGEYSNWSRRWMQEAYRLLSPTGTFWLAIGDEWVADLRVMAREIGFHLRSWVVWYFGFGVNCQNKFTRSHTHLLYFTKHRKNFTFHADQIKVPSARQLLYNDKRAKPGGRLPDDTWVLLPQSLPEGFLPDHDVWSIPRVCGTHKQRQEGAANQLPEELLGRIITACSSPGDVVLDPMVGTGTTLVVAKKLGRRYTGFELSDKFAEMARNRLTAANCGDSLA